MNFANTKERILQFIDYKNLTIRKFLEETGIKRGFLDTDKLNASVSDVFITIIIEKYPEINLHWLITGKGEMIAELKEYPTNDSLMKIAEPGEANEVVIAQKKTITILEREVEDLRNDKSFLKNVIENKLGKEKSA